MYLYNPTLNYNHPIQSIQRQNQQKNGLNLTWDNVNVNYKTIFSRKPKKHILKNQFGKINEGELVGLLGSR